MNKKLIIVLSFAALLLISSCMEKEVSPEKISFSEKIKPLFFTSIASFDESSSTKTVLDNDLKLCWNEDDEVSVFNGNTGNQKYVYAGSDGTKDGPLSYQSGAASATLLSKIYAFYPYSGVNTISESGVITAYTSREQEYVPNSFGCGTNLMLAQADEGERNLTFKNLCGYLRISLTGSSTVTSIRLKGNSNELLAGEMVITPSSEGGSLSMDADSFKEVVLNCPEGVELSSTPSYFYFALPPTVFAHGITVEIFDNDGRFMVKSSSASISISQNRIKPMEPFTYSATNGVPASFVGLQVLGAYGPDDDIYYQYTKGKDQTVTSSLGSSYNFRLLNTVDEKILAIDGIPVNALPGDVFNVTSYGYNLVESIPDGELETRVLRKKGNLIWLSDTGTNKGFIVKRP